MYGTSDRFAAAIGNSQAEIAKVEVFRGPTTVAELKVRPGATMTIDSEDATRRSCDLEVIDESGALSADDARELLHPLTSTLQLYRGIRFPYADENGDVDEFVPSGMFRPISRIVKEVGGATVMQLACYDLSTKAQKRLTRPIAIRNNIAVELAVTKLVTAKVPDAQFNLHNTGFVTPALLITAGSNAWTEAVDLAETAGCELYVDRNGVFTMDPRPSQAAQSHVLHFREGVNATFWDVERSVTVDDLPNVVTVDGTHSALSTVVHGEAADLDPVSPTYRFGEYPETVHNEPSEKVTSNGQANAMAKALLIRKLAGAEEITFSAVPDPRLDVGDTIAISRERLGLFERRMLVTKIELPFGAEDEMTVTCRRSVITEDVAA